MRDSFLLSSTPDAPSASLTKNASRALGWAGLVALAAPAALYGAAQLIEQRSPTYRHDRTHPPLGAESDWLREHL